MLILGFVIKRLKGHIGFKSTKWSFKRRGGGGKCNISWSLKNSLATDTNARVTATAKDTATYMAIIYRVTAMP